MQVELKESNKENYEQVGELYIPDKQQQHLSENIWSIAESLLHDTHEARAIYKNEDLVGFVMWVCVSEVKSAIWRFMIAHKHQSQGVGRKALMKAIQEIKHRKGIKEIEICYSPDNAIAKKLYFSVGFVETGLTDDGAEAYAIIKSGL